MEDKKRNAAGKELGICLGIMLATQIVILVPLALFLWCRTPFVTPLTVAGVFAAVVVADVFVIGLTAASARSQVEPEGGEDGC